MAIKLILVHVDASPRSAVRLHIAHRLAREPRDVDHAAATATFGNGVLTVVIPEVKRRIEEAFKRSAEVDARRFTVEANGGEVTLRGTVRSWAEREEASRTAWRAPGVTKVTKLIAVDPLFTTSSQDAMATA